MNTKSILVTTILILIMGFNPQVQSRADVKKALENLQEGLDEALLTTIPDDRKYVRFERREEGILLYKASIQKIDDTTVRIRVTGYDNQDEASIITFMIISGDSYRTIGQSQNRKRKK
jgi:hypothetical protein